MHPQRIQSICCPKRGYREYITTLASSDLLAASEVRDETSPSIRPEIYGPVLERCFPSFDVVLTRLSLRCSVDNTSIHNHLVTGSISSRRLGNCATSQLVPYFLLAILPLSSGTV